jgi:hypothetical protein
MQRFNRLLVCALLAAFTLGANMPEVQAVYLLPMAGGLDQYLANRLTAGSVFRVVTDPKLADAVFTDQLGAAFERKLGDLYPPPESKDSDKPDTYDKPAPHISSFGRGRGTIFLVDLKSREVIWSLYQRPSKATSEVLDRTAAQIVQQIKKQQKTK